METSPEKLLAFTAALHCTAAKCGNEWERKGTLAKRHLTVQCVESGDIRDDN